jgi:hypothetical protein
VQLGIAGARGPVKEGSGDQPMGRDALGSPGTAAHSERPALQVVQCVGDGFLVEVPDRLGDVLVAQGVDEGHRLGGREVRSRAATRRAGSTRRTASRSPRGE